MDTRRKALADTILTTIVAILVLVLAWSLLSDDTAMLIPAVAAVGLTVIAFATIRTTISPDRVRATQTSRTLKIASKSLEYLRGGLSIENAQQVCELLLPETQAVAVGITDTTTVLGYVGKGKEHFGIGDPIRTKVTKQVLKTGKHRIVTDFTEVPSIDKRGSKLAIAAAIIVPLKVREKSMGTLKFYYTAPHLVDKTQTAIALGLAELLSTQLLLSELDHQAELTTRAELRALQTQIRPHFLYNTINTIASLIRTDPQEARLLLREFAAFYRWTLEGSGDFIPLEREIKQTRSYFGFEVARFGKERLKLLVDIEPGTEEVLVPAFIIQPIVENCVNHAMKDTGQLRICVEVYSEEDDLVIAISDDGVGMDMRVLNSDANIKSDTAGTGIALKNVTDRLKGFFGDESSLSIDSALGEGTTVTMRLQGARSAEEDEE